MYSPGGGVISIRSCRRLILLLTITSPHFGHCNLTNPLSFLYPIITCPQFVHRRCVGFHVFCITHKPSFLVTCRGMDLSSAYVRSRTPAPKKLISANHIQSVSAFNTFLYSLPTHPERRSYQEPYLSFAYFQGAEQFSRHDGTTFSELLHHLSGRRLSRRRRQ